MTNSLLIHIALRHIRPETLNHLQVNAVDHNNLATNPQRRMEQLISRSWRRQILATQLDQSPENLCFAKDSYGKPYLVNTPNLQFSQSHCAQQFVLVFNQQRIAIGVDIEARQRTINLAGLAKRILTAAEMQVFTQAANPQAYLLKCWTIKEAVLKASGLGIRLNLNTLETHYSGSEPHTNSAVAYQAAIGEWAYQCFATEAYYYSVAWQHHSAQQVSFNWLP
ncbi:4'-phosphopantetheinyl transferase family protein [Alkanindiges illinoisensis]|uniref:4'-phosphopantetheinyl transferase family protein n=1 Tax=Alkanindiges illinoisensis TaxID=197183 RepID=UPI00068887D6|nr:4'-phosphopantetheinyl transferase superfamily protein [Alkanindiges illinoisensis]